jgi:phage shock protein PspC (stress-responsive transcriptional regulator)
MNRRLYRSTEHKIIGGVCGGIGEHFDIDPTWVRLAAVALTLLHGAGILLYIIGWIIIPKHPAVESPSNPPAPAAPPAAKPNGRSRSIWPGVILIALGVLFLFHKLFWWFELDHVWPILLILAGVALLYGAFRNGRARQNDPEALHEPR